MQLTTSEFIASLALHNFIDRRQAAELDQAAKTIPGIDALAKHVVALGWLTEFQAEHIIIGEIEGLRVDNYRLIEPIGAGGMGQVFKAVHLRLKRVVAVKIISPTFLKTSSDPTELVRRFEREAQAAAQVLHTNIVTLFDYNVVDGMPFIAMEYIQGVDMANMVQKQGPLSYQRACDYIRQAATGLQHVFAAGLVHRDIKPHNLLITQSDSKTKSDAGLGAKQLAEASDSGSNVQSYGVVKILDLGLARLQNKVNAESLNSALTIEGAVLGTPDFIAPEQARDPSRVDIRADLYSLGCTFYYLLTGRPPFPGDNTVVEKILAHQNEDPVSIQSIRPNTPPEIAAIVKKLMAKKPQDRYQSPAELIEAIDNVALELWSGIPRHIDAEVLPVPGGPPLAATSIRMDQIQRRKVNADDPFLLPAKKLAILDRHRTMVTSVTLSPGSHKLASGDLEGNVRLWKLEGDTQTELSLDNSKGLSEIRQVFFGRKGRILFACTTGMESKIWYWDVLTPTNERRQFPTCGYITNCHVVSPDGGTVVASSGGAVLLFRLKSPGRPVILRGHNAEIRAVAYSPSGKRLFSAGEDRRIVVWEPGRMWGNQRAVLLGHEAPITALTVAADARHIASASLDGSIRLWKAKDDTYEHVRTLTGHMNGIRMIRFVASSSLLLSMCERGNIFLWDTDEGVKVRQWQSDKGIIHSMALSTNGRFVATGTGDGRVVLYDLNLAVEAGATASWAHAV